MLAGVWGAWMGHSQDFHCVGLSLLTWETAQNKNSQRKNQQFIILYICIINLHITLTEIEPNLLILNFSSLHTINHIFISDNHLTMTIKVT